MDLFLQALDSVTVTLTLTDGDFEVDRSGGRCRVTPDLVKVMDAVTLTVANVANDLSLTAISHTSSDTMNRADPAEYRDHHVDVSLR